MNNFNSDLILFEIERKLSEPSRINNFIKQNHLNINLKDEIERYQTKILEKIDKNKIENNNLDFYIEQIDNKTLKHINKKINKKYIIDSTKFNNQLCSFYQIQLDKKYNIYIEKIENQEPDFNIFTHFIQIDNTKIYFQKKLYDQQMILNTINHYNFDLQLDQDNFVTYDANKHILHCDLHFDTMLNIREIKQKKEIYERQKNMIDIYINEEFIKQVNIQQFEPFYIGLHDNFQVQFFEANTNIPFQFYKPHKLILNFSDKFN